MTMRNATVEDILSRAISDGVSLLAEDEGKALLARFGIGGPDGRRALDVAEAEAAAQQLGYPLVVKALVPGLAQKTELGAVKLGMRDKEVELQRICMDECREFLEPRGVLTFMQIEEPFQALSILSRCAEVAKGV
jgi:acyl-CoA synthetase (NDP forming)